MAENGTSRLILPVRDQGAGDAAAAQSQDRFVTEIS